MPEYSYFCEKCKQPFSVVCSISNYKEKCDCDLCGNLCSRDYEDLKTLNASVKLSDSEIKTVGHLAQRNTEKMSRDQRAELYVKHNEYKYDKPEQALPKGMTRIKKPPKTKWT